MPDTIPTSRRPRPSEYPCPPWCKETEIPGHQDNDGGHFSADTASFDITHPQPGDQPGRLEAHCHVFAYLGDGSAPQVGLTHGDSWAAEVFYTPAEARRVAAALRAAAEIIEEAP